jgi:hypothetical protein
MNGWLRGWRFARGSVFALLGWLACGPSDAYERETPSRYLDDVCRGDACVTTGSATRAPGVTSDTIGYRVGPGRGELRIPLHQLPRLYAPDHYARWAVAILVSGRGSFTSTGCPGARCADGGTRTRFNAPDDYSWIELRSSDADVAGDAGDSDARTDMDLQIDVDDGSVIDIVDVRYTESVGSPAC